MSERLSSTTSPSRRSSPTSSRISVFASSSCEQLDIPLIHDPVDEVAGHALVQVVAPYEQENLPCALCQEQHSLARRVAPADDRDLLTFAALGLNLRGGVMDAYTLETPEAWHAEPAVAGPGCRDHAACCDFAIL